MTRKSTVFLLGATALGLTMSASMASAQTVPAQPATPTAAASDAQGDISDIIVTATRVETSLQKTPVAITALSGAQLQQKNIVSLVDVGNYVPSLSIGGRGGQGTNQGNVTLRGIGVNAPDSSPSVGLYIDEVYYPSVTGNLLGLFDVARVEVLRGPQGTLFGRNTIAGAIQFISTKPEVGKFSGYAEGGGGNLGTYRFTGAVNIPLGNTLALRVAAQVNNQGGYVHDILNDIYRGEDHTTQERVQLRWTPFDGLTIDLKGEHVIESNNGRPVVNGAFDGSAATIYQIATGTPPFNTVPPGIPAPFRETRPVLASYVTPFGSYENAGFNQPDYLRMRYDSGNAVIGYDVSDNVHFKSITAYSFTRARAQTDFDQIPLNIIRTDRGTQRDYLLTQEAKLSGTSIGGRLRWSTGVFYYDGSTKTTDFASIIANLPPSYNAETKIENKSIAVYGQATFDIAAGFSATGGLRYSHETIKAVYTNGLLPTNQVSYNDTSPYIGLNWQANADLLIYAKASKGFRAGGFHADPGFTGGSLAYGPETAWTYEAGARLSLFNHRLRFNPTVYFTDWSNIQFTYIALRPGPIASTQNAGDAKQNGVELETQFSATKHFDLTGSFSYLNAYYTRLAAPTPGSIPIVLSLSDELPRSPAFKFAIGGRYRIDLQNGGRVLVSADYAWTQHQRSQTDRGQAVTMPTYGLLSARVQYTPAGDRFTFALYGSNLTDKFYLIDGVNFAGNSGTKPLTPGRPREFGGSVKVAF